MQNNMDACRHIIHLVQGWKVKCAQHQNLLLITAPAYPAQNNNNIHCNMLPEETYTYTNEVQQILLINNTQNNVEMYMHAYPWNT